MNNDLGHQSTLLLAENAEQLLKAQLAVLRDLGFSNILTARTGTQAWDLLKNSQVDLVLSSWSMPEMNGIALLKVIRSDSGLRETPFILVAGEITRVR